MLDVVVENSPGRHDKQRGDLSFEENVPGRHSMHAVERDSGCAFPFGHEEHNGDNLRAANRPAGHGLAWDDMAGQANPAAHSSQSELPFSFTEAYPAGHA